MLGKRVVCVFYKVSAADFAADEDGLGPLGDLNIIDINDLGNHFAELRKRARRAMRSVFLSYPLRDRALALVIERQLEQLGLDAFNPATEVRAGDDWRAAIHRAMKKVDALILLVASPEATASSSMAYEAGIADALGKRTIVMISQDRSTSELPADIAANRLLQFDPKSPVRAAREVFDELAAA